MFEMEMGESNEVASTWFDVNESTECSDAIELLYYSRSSAPSLGAPCTPQYSKLSAAKRIEWCEQQQQTQLQQHQQQKAP